MINRRLENEMKKLAQLPYNIQRYENQIRIRVRGSILTLVLSESYPFQKPDIFVDDIPYKYFLRLPSKRFETVLSKICEECCLLCHSYECNARWSACVTIEMIINEILRIQRLKQEICYYWLIESIKDEFNLPHEIPIFDFLLQKK